MMSSYALSIQQPPPQQTTTTNSPTQQRRRSTTTKPSSQIGTPPPEIWPQLVVGGKEDPAMGRIEQTQKKIQKPYGDVLDAGTGMYSLRWLAGLLYRYNKNDDDDGGKDPLYMSSYVAVTADDNFRRDCQRKAEELGISEYGEIIRGNWDIENVDDDDDGSGDNNQSRDKLCAGQMFDTILADYLVGAIDHFSPFYQDKLFDRLSTHLKKGGVMHLTGLNPIPEKVSGPGNIFCRITKLRDACILLAGSRPYREHPCDWVVRHLERSGFDVVDVAKFPNKYTYEKVEVQINACRSTLEYIDDDELRETMGKRIDRIDDECKKICEECENGEFTLGYDWVITAIKK